MIFQRVLLGILTMVCCAQANCNQETSRKVSQGQGREGQDAAEIGRQQDENDCEVGILTGGTVMMGGMTSTISMPVVGGTTFVIYGGAVGGGGNQTTSSNHSGGNIVIPSIPGNSTGGTIARSTDVKALINGLQWSDVQGNPIQAHGGGVVFADGYYYWFGENRHPNGKFFAISAYRSKELTQWEFVNHVLRNTSGPGLDPANVERPKIVYNTSTKKYVMWMHWENGTNYGEARAAVASSDTVAGAYTYHGSFRPLSATGVTDHGKPGYMSRDCGLFVDDDGTGYFISASNENYDLNLYRLSADYLGIEKLIAVLFKGDHREAPVLWKRNGIYFLLTSGATGWSPNQAMYATSKTLNSGWSSLNKVGDNTTNHSQSTFVFPIQGKKSTTFLYMGDRWAGAWKGKVNDSTYVWLPLTFPNETSLALSWNNTLTFDTITGTVHGKTLSFHIVNVKSGKALAAAAIGNHLVQSNVEEATTQTWNFLYNGAGFFLIKNEKTNQVLDVLDESKADGAPLGQWEDLGGDNQLWTLIHIGNNRYKIRNKLSEKFVSVMDSHSIQLGAPIIQRSDETSESQQWEFIPSHD